MRQKEKDSRQKEKPHGKRKRLKAKRKPHGKKKKTHGKISSIPRGHFNSYFFCREVTCNCFIVTVVGHRTFEFLFPKILDFPTCGYSWDLARTLLIWLAFKPYRIHGLARSENAGHFCMSDKWKQSFQNTAFCNCCSRRRTRTRFNLIPSLHVSR